MHVCEFSHFSHVRLVATLWIVAHQAHLAMGFSREEYLSGFSFPSPSNLYKMTQSQWKFRKSVKCITYYRLRLSILI